MRPLFLYLTLLAGTLSAQTNDWRIEASRTSGSSVARLQIGPPSGSQAAALDPGLGVRLVFQRTLLEEPVLRLGWNLEVEQLRATGTLGSDHGGQALHTMARSLGVGLTAQFWAPFLGVGAEAGLTQKVHRVESDGAGLQVGQTIHRTWLKAGLRFRLPASGVRPYMAATYQQALQRGDHAAQASLPGLLRTLEIQRHWSLGLGLIY